MGSPRNSGPSRSLQYGEFPLDDLLMHNLDLSQQSHSELSAARDILRSAWEEIRTSHVRLPSPSRTTISQTSRANLHFFKVPRISKRLLRHLIELIVSLGFAAFLVAIFVAETTGVVLSANLISDTVALIVSPTCTNLVPRSGFADWRHFNYQQECYKNGPSVTSADCNVYVNRIITYGEQYPARCPFKDDVCLQPAYVLDTGYINAKDIGLNTPKDYFLRRITSCAPVWSRNHTAFIAYDGTDESITNGLPLAFTACNFTSWSGSLDGYTRSISMPPWTYLDVDE